MTNARHGWRGRWRTDARRARVTTIGVAVALLAMPTLRAGGEDAGGPDTSGTMRPTKLYRLHVGDVVEVSVLGHPDTICPAVPVAPDGKLYYMFRPGISAAGRLPTEVAADIEAGLQDLFVDPHVAVLPTEFASANVMVYGKVRFPGVYPLRAPTTIRRAIAYAGGIAQGTYRGTTIEVASFGKSYLLRGDRRLEVDFAALMRDNDASQDRLLEPGDVLHIASGLSEKAEVYVLGRVKEARAVAYTDGMTLVGAISGGADQGGGLAEGAHLAGVAIVRGSLDTPDVVKVDLKRVLAGKARDVYLLPGDIVYVPARPYRFAEALAREAVITFARTFASEAGAHLVEEIIPPTQESN